MCLPKYHVLSALHHLKSSKWMPWGLRRVARNVLRETHFASCHHDGCFRRIALARRPEIASLGLSLLKNHTELIA